MILIVTFADLGAHEVIVLPVQTTPLAIWFQVLLGGFNR